MLEAPKLGAAFKWVSQGQSRGGESPPQRAGHADPHTAQDVVTFWTASAFYQVVLSFLSTSIPKSFSLGLLSTHSLLNLCFCLGLSQHRCGTLHLTLLNMRFTQAHLKPDKVTLDGIPSLWCVDTTTHLGGVKLAEVALNPSVHVWAMCCNSIVITAVRYLRKAKTCLRSIPAVEGTNNWKLS